jgi:hypothetical protein
LDTSASEVRVTWVSVPNFSGGGTGTFQYQFRPDGTVHVVWQSVTGAGNSFLVGWTPGGGASDPGNRDLSATLSTPLVLCSGPFTGIVLAANQRPVFGTTVNLATSNIPAGSLFAALVLSFTQAIPPQDLGPLGMPGCFGHTVGGTSFLYLLPPPSVSSNLFIPADPSYTGAAVIGQSFSYSPPLTPLGVIAANGLRLVLGPM